MTRHTVTSSSRRIRSIDAGDSDVIVRRTGSDAKWDIRDKILPQFPLSVCDVFDTWPDGNCRYVYDTGSSPEAERHWSGWAMRNTNNHNKTVLKKSCLGLLVCSRKHCDVRLRPAICHKARSKQIGTPCSSASCDGLMQLVPCRGHRGFPVTHFWRADPACGSIVFFQSKGFHDHPRPEQPWSAGEVGAAVKLEDSSSPGAWLLPITPPAEDWPVTDDCPLIQVPVHGKRKRSSRSGVSSTDGESITYSSPTKMPKLGDSTGFPSPRSDCCSYVSSGNDVCTTPPFDDVTSGGSWAAPLHWQPLQLPWKNESECEQQQWQQWAQPATPYGSYGPAYTPPPGSSNTLAVNPDRYPHAAAHVYAYESPHRDVGVQFQPCVRFSSGHVTSPNCPSSCDNAYDELSFYVRPDEPSENSGSRDDDAFQVPFDGYNADASGFSYERDCLLSDLLEVMKCEANGGR